MRKIQKWGSLLLLLSLLLSAGCVKRYRSEFMEKRVKRGNTEEERLAAYYDSFRFIALKWDDAKNKFLVVPNLKLTYEMLRKQLDDRLKDFEQILAYKNEEWAQFIKYFGLRAEYERKEELLKLTRDRVRVVELDNIFRKEMDLRADSTSGFDTDSDHGGVDPYNRVDIKKFYAPADMKTLYAFESDTINEARKNGTLKEVEDFDWGADQIYGKKEPDPGDPDDQNKFTWRRIRRVMKFKGYKIISVGTEKVRIPDVDYIEGFRINDKGKPESRPALKVFVRQYKAVLVVDQDQEHELGFGLPEIVDSISRTTSARSLMNENLVSLLFPEKPKEKRIPPAKKPDMKIEVAQVGQPVDLWEKSPDKSGWKAPIYRNNRADNYDIKIKFFKHKKDVDPDSADARMRQIEHMVKIYKTTSRAVEYYKPKADYAKRNILRADDGLGDGKKIKIEFDNGEEKTGNVTPGSNLFTEDKPEKIAFDEGGKRFVIWDKDGDGTFELKMEVALDANTGHETSSEAMGNGNHMHDEPVRFQPQVQAIP